MGWGPFSYQHMAKGLYEKFEKMSSLSGGAMTEERAEEIAEAMPYDVLRTYVLPAVRCPLTDNLIRKAVQFYLSADPRLKNSVIQRFGEIENWDVSRVTSMENLFFLDYK